MSMRTIPCIHDDSPKSVKQPRVSNWIHSPTGKYGVHLQHQYEYNWRMRQFYTNYEVSVLDVLNGSRSSYRTLFGPLQKIYAVYWLQDDCFVLVAHTLDDSFLTQNIVHLDHRKKTAECTLARTYAWEIMGMMENPSHICQPLTIDNQVYFLAFAKEEMGALKISCRLFPLNPLGQTEDLAITEFSLLPYLFWVPLEFGMRFTGNTHPIVVGNKFYMNAFTTNRGGHRRWHFTHNVSTFMCVDMEEVVRRETSEISRGSVTWVSCPVPYNPTWEPFTMSAPFLSYSGSKVIFWPRRRNSCRVPIYVVDFGTKTTTTTSARLTRSDFVTLDRFGTVSAWFQHENEPLKTQSLSYARFAPDSLFNTCRKQILSVNLGPDARKLPELIILFQN